MIVRTVFNPIAVMRYMRVELFVSTVVSLAVYFLSQNNASGIVALPFSLTAIVGSALAIFIAFRNNTAYSRWWEARTQWGTIVNNSRIIARQVIANTANAVAIGKISQQQCDDYTREVIVRQIAFAHALRLHLRQQDSWNEVSAFLPEQEYRELLHKTNKPNYILQKQGEKIKEGIRTEYLGAFDMISIEPAIAGIVVAQGSCERIKYTPLLRQYHFFTRLFLLVFMVLLPLTLIGDFTKMDMPFLMVPISILISFVFGVMSKVGEVNENPFENTITDVPMTSLCHTIECDMKEMLGDTVTRTTVPHHGFIY